MKHPAPIALALLALLLIAADVPPRYGMVGSRAIDCLDSSGTPTRIFVAHIALIRPGQAWYGEDGVATNGTEVVLAGVETFAPIVVVRPDYNTLLKILK